MDDLTNLFTEKNLLILKEISSKNDTYLREIAENTGISPAKVHQATRLFKRLGIIRERKDKNKKMISLDETSVIPTKIRQLRNIHLLTTHRSYKELKKYGSVGIYGSFVSGKDTPESEIEMWFYPKKHIGTAKMKSIIIKLEADFRRKVRLLMLTDKIIISLKEEYPEFYLKLKLTSVGEDIFD